jgi:hypothetical protein
MAKAKVFFDENGNRFIFPSHIYREEDENSMSMANIIIDSMMLGVALNLSVEKEWLEFDPENFPNIRTMALSRAFEHGGATVLLFARPDFEQALVKEKETNNANRG